MAVFDIVHRKQETFQRISGFEIKYHQLSGTGIIFHTIVYSRKVAEILLKEVNSVIDDPFNFIRAYEDPLEIREAAVFYRAPRWKIEIPYSALTGDMLLKLEDKAEIFRELSITSHTIRDHFFSFMNAATNFNACVRDSEELLEENLKYHKKEVAAHDK